MFSGANGVRVKIIFPIQLTTSRMIGWHSIDRQSARATSTVYVCVMTIHTYSACVVILFILDVRLVDAPAGVTQKEGHTRFLHLPSAVLALIFIARRI